MDRRVRTAILTKNAHFTAKLAHYRAGLVQPPHRHAASQVSFLLVGSVEEDTATSRFRLSNAHVGRKAGGAVHSNRFGPDGALMLSFHFNCEETAALVLPDNRISWSRMDDRQLSDATAAASADEAFRPDWLWDQLAIVTAAPRATRIPEWLKWVRHQLETAPHAASLAELANEAGVHRVHLSREFSRHFGISATAFRQKQMVANALNRMVQHKVPGILAAHEAGFADQSHMIRTMKRRLGGVAGLMKALN